MKHGFGKLASLEDARNIIADLVGTTEDVEVTLDEVLDRVLASDIIAKINVPHFRKSAMDGYAVIASDTFGASNTKPKELEIIESVTAGVIPKKDLGEGECISITTGAPMPEKADGVLMVEYTEREGDKLTCYKSCAPGDNVISVGSDVKKDEIVLKSGTKVLPSHIGVLSAIGVSRITVKRKPRVAYFSTGNEILGIQEKLAPGKIHDINSYTIINALKKLDCEIVKLEVVRDDKKLLKEKMLEGLERADFLVISGGSSLGGEDFLKESVEELGDVLVHGIAVKPGKPVLVGRINERLVLGLPGYPASALSNFYILVKPVIERMIGVKTQSVTLKAKLSRKIASTIGRFEFLPVLIRDGEAIPVLKGSSAITTMALADGYVEIEENNEVLEKGEEVEVTLF